MRYKYSVINKKKPYRPASLRTSALRFIIITSAATAICAIAPFLYFIAAPDKESVDIWLCALASILFSALTATVLSVYFSKKLSHLAKKSLDDIDVWNPEYSSVVKEHEQFTARLAKHNAEIDEKIRELEKEHEDQEAMRRDFTANVSHELKTPLTSISGYAEIIKNGLARGDDAIRFAGKIYDESQRLVTLVGDIIKLSQLDSKEIEFPSEEIDLFALCEKITSQLELPAKQQGIKFYIYGEHAVIRGAVQIVEEIIFNIADNAVKYNKENGTVTFSIRRCLDGVELTIADTGIGIAPKDLPHIFKRFYRVDRSHSKEIGGTGLGLSIVKHGAMFIGASVSVQSSLGVGTTIKVLF